MEINAKDALSAWKESVAVVRSRGTHVGKERDSLELLNLLVTVRDAANIAYPIEFLTSSKQWVYPSLREIEDIILARRNQSPYYYSYGAKLFGGPGKTNQIHDFIIPLLKSSPDTRRACAIITEPQDARGESSHQMSSVIAVDFKLRDGRLHSTMFIRSNDVFIGWPANIYQLFVLTEYVAARVNVPLGTLSTLSTSAHLFTEYDSDIKKLLK